jgi:hypothetical protein
MFLYCFVSFHFTWLQDFHVTTRKTLIVSANLFKSHSKRVLALPRQCSMSIHTSYFRMFKVQLIAWTIQWWTNNPTCFLPLLLACSIHYSTAHLPHPSSLYPIRMLTSAQHFRSDPSNHPLQNENFVSILTLLDRGECGALAFSALWSKIANSTRNWYNLEQSPE